MDLFHVFSLVRWRKSKICKENGGWVGNKTSASDFNRKYICYPAISDTLFSQIFIFFQLTLMCAVKIFFIRDIYTYIYIYFKMSRSMKRFALFLGFIYLFYSYIRVCFQLIALVREHIWHKALFMGYLLRLELTCVCSLNGFQLVMSFYEGHSSLFHKVFTKACFTPHLLLIFCVYAWKNLRVLESHDGCTTSLFVAWFSFFFVSRHEEEKMQRQQGRICGNLGM